MKGSAKAKKKKTSKENANERDVTAFTNRLWPDGVLSYQLQRSTIGNFNIFDFSVSTSLVKPYFCLKSEQYRHSFYFPEEDKSCKLFQPDTSYRKMIKTFRIKNQICVCIYLK